MDATVTDAMGTWVNYTNNWIKGGIWLLANATPISQAPPTMPQYRRPFDLGTAP